jgi:hypothetical protein
VDLAKAFDSVSFCKLGECLEASGVGSTLSNWIKYYVTGRCQQVEIGNTLSAPADIKSGILQGSCIGPSLFLCFIQSLLSQLEQLQNVEVYCFADNLKLFSHSFDDLQQALELSFGDGSPLNNMVGGVSFPTP